MSGSSRPPLWCWDVRSRMPQFFDQAPQAVRCVQAGMFEGGISRLFCGAPQRTENESKVHAVTTHCLRRGRSCRTTANSGPAWGFRLDCHRGPLYPSCHPRRRSSAGTSRDPLRPPTPELCGTGLRTGPALASSSESRHSCSSEHRRTNTRLVRRRTAPVIVHDALYVRTIFLRAWCRFPGAPDRPVAAAAALPVHGRRRSAGHRLTAVRPCRRCTAASSAPAQVGGPGVPPQSAWAGRRARIGRLDADQIPGAD